MPFTRPRLFLSGGNSCSKRLFGFGSTRLGTFNFLQHITMISFLLNLVKNLLGVFLNILPLLVVVTAFQLFVIKQPFPDLAATISGLIFVLVGLFLFIQGLEIGLFPLGEKMAFQFSAKGNIWWLLIFGFAIGFSTTIAEPALIAVARKAGEIAAEANAIPHTNESIASYAFWLRVTVALSVGVSHFSRSFTYSQRLANPLVYCYRILFHYHSYHFRTKRDCWNSL